VNHQKPTEFHIAKRRLQSTLVRILISACASAFTLAFTTVLATNPGIALTDAEQNARIIKDLTAAIKRNPKNWCNYEKRAVAYHLLGDNRKAIADYSKAISLDTKQPSLYESRALRYADMKQFSKAIKDCNTALGLIPHDYIKYEYADTYVTRAQVYRKDKQYKKALADCNTAIGFAPNVASLSAVTRSGSYFNSVIARHGIASAYKERAMLYYQQGKLKNAIADLSKSISIEPKSAASYAMRAIVYQKLGMTEKASADVNTAKTLAPELIHD
jgi:tetratricopeptide (TPR) repeat protein